MDLKSIDEKELREELARREKERLERERLRKEQLVDRFLRAVRENVDVLIAVTPMHSRTSCDDTNLSNGHRGCARCVLLDYKTECSRSSSMPTWTTLNILVWEENQRNLPSILESIYTNFSYE